MSVIEMQPVTVAPEDRPMKLIEALKIVNAPPQQAAQHEDVFIVCGFTPLHLQTFLEAHLLLRSPDRRVRVNSGLYGDVAGNLERAAAAAPDAVAVVLEWPDFDPRLGVRTAGSAALSRDELRESIYSQMDRFQKIIDERLAETTLALSLPSLPARHSCIQQSWLADPVNATLRRCFADFSLWASERKNIRLLNADRLDQLSPPNARWDAGAELATGFPYHLNHTSILADLLSRLIRLPLPKKGLITDLDDTLWRGIVGEAGVDGISWTLDRHTHHHALYQQQLSVLAHAGVFVAVASKNDPSVIREAFARPDLLLDVNHIFPLEVSWGPKSVAVGRILQTWNVGPDSIVFVDDSPMELAEVQAAFPGIQCLLFPKNDPQACLGLLDRLRDLFGKRFISEEDALRTNSLRAQPALSTDFLETAEAEITFSAVKNSSDSRPFELINKTNQFNLNGRRFTDSEWLHYLQDPETHLLSATYRDKYGALGKIAVLGARQSHDKFFIDVWVMSCRAFSRRIEHQCLLRLFKAHGVDEISFDFRRTPRNNPIQEFFAGLVGENPEGPLTLTLAQFEQRCPRLFHTVKDG